MSHTPGPWEAAGSATFANGKQTNLAYFVRRPGDDVSIADEIQDPDTGKPSKENALLIAAAPDLLSALHAIRAIVYEADYDRVTLKSVFNIATDAITKTERKVPA